MTATKTHACDAPAQPSSVFWETAAVDPGRIAFVVDGTGDTRTYGELALAANRVANGLLDRGMVAGDVVALVLPNRIEYTAIQLGALQVGMVIVPVNRHLTAPELAHILSDCKASIVVVDAQTAQPVAEAVADAGLDPDTIVAVDAITGIRAVDEILGAPTPPRDRVSGSVLFYSSGTTGRPKGIRRPNSERSPEDYQTQLAQMGTSLGLGPGGVYLSLGPLYHAAPNQTMMMALQLGKTVVLSSGFDAEQVLNLIETHQVTDAFLVPTMMHRLVSLPPERRLRADVSSLRCILHAGAICPVATKQAMIDWVGTVLVEYYGASESGAATLVTADEWLTRPGTVGRARPGMSVRICDETGRRLPTGEVGLIHLGTGLRIEYLGDPEKTQNSYVDGHFVPGDVGYLDEDGYLFVCDRRTDMIISGGVNIYPAEIEAALLSYDSVVDTVVFGVTDEEWGQKVVALVELGAGTADESGVVAAIREHCSTRLAKYKVPRVLQVMDRIPRNPAGKINRSRMREVFETNASS